jgi:hypothetical protein
LNNETKDRLLKIIPMLGSDNEGEILATVFAIKRVLEASKFTMHDLAKSIRSNETREDEIIRRAGEQARGGSKVNTPKPRPQNWSYQTTGPDFKDVLSVCESFRNIVHPQEQDAFFIDQLYLDLNILRENYYMSQLEIARFEEIKRRYHL